MTSRAWYKKPEMIVALSALLISVITTIVSIYSATIDRAYARASMWPRIELFRSFGGNNFNYGIVNNGNGPAIIKYALVSHDEKNIRRWTDIPNMPEHTQSHMGTRILPPQQTITPTRTTGKAAKVFEEIDKKVKITICYCSIYDECWLTDRENNPLIVERCEIDDKKAFLQ